MLVRECRMDAMDEVQADYKYIPFPNSNHGMYNDLDKMQEFIDLSLHYCEVYLPESHNG